MDVKVVTNVVLRPIMMLAYAMCPRVNVLHTLTNVEAFNVCSRNLNLD